MAATTTNYAFPYPEDADVVDVAGDLQSLAQDIDSKLSEAIADTVGALVTSNTENGISVSYQDSDNTLDFDVADFTLTFLGDVSGSATITNLASASATITIEPNSVALGTDTTGNYVATITGTANEIEVSGSGSETASVTIGLPNDVTIGNNLTVTGDLVVSGSATYLNVEQLLVEDNLITLNSSVSGSPSLNAGIEIERGTSANTDIRWNESLDVWQFTNDGTNYYTIKDFDTALGTKTTDNLTQGSTNLYFTDEKAQDAVAAAIAAGTHTNITITYNDATNSLDFVGSASISNETIQDAVAPLLVHANHTNVTATYDDANNEIILVGSAASGGGGTSTNVALSSSWWLGV